jgi:hypothetical protein
MKINMFYICIYGLNSKPNHARIYFSSTFPSSVYLKKKSKDKIVLGGGERERERGIRFNI